MAGRLASTPLSSSSPTIAVAFFERATDTQPGQQTLAWDKFVDRVRKSADDDPVQVGTQPTDPQAAKVALDELKRSTARFSPVRYREGATRGNDGVDTVHAFVADLDGSAREDTDAMLDKLRERGLRFVAWTTWSHGWAKPNAWRVVVQLAEPVPAALWRRAWPAMNDELFKGKCDEATSDPARMHTLPARPEVILAASGAWVPTIPVETVESDDGAPFDAGQLTAQAELDEDRERQRDEERMARAREARANESDTDRVRRERYAQTALDGKAREVASIPPGQGKRFLTLRDAAYRVGSFVQSGDLDATTAERELYAAAESNGYVADHGQHDTRSLILSGFRKAKPWDGSLSEREPPPRARKSRAKLALATAPVLDDGAPLQRDLESGEWRPARQRPSIRIGTDIGPVIRDAIDALANQRNVYQRAGQLVTVSHDQGDAPTIASMKRAADAPRIASINAGYLRMVLSEAAEWSLDATGRSTLPPRWAVESIMGLPHFGAVKPLRGFVEAPTLRPDGTVLDKPGYDPSTGLFLNINCIVPPVAEHPTRDDAQAAIRTLIDPVREFPFKDDKHLATYVALILTSLSRHAFDGPAPLFLVDANTAGTGKTKLCDIASVIATGRPAARMTAPRSDDETRKSITAIALAGDPLVLVDNIAGGFGGPVWDATLTATTHRDRILGRNDAGAAITVPLCVTWLASGNNVELRGDTHRRIAHIRLESPHEAPDTRDGFQHPDVVGFTTRERGRLIHAGLTILRAYCAAGRPPMGIPAWGSFEAWSALVRSTVVWAGLPDPGLAREELRSTADGQRAALDAVLALWSTIDPRGRGLTVPELKKHLDDDNNADLRQAFDEMGVDPRDGHALGGVLRRYRGVVRDGKRLNHTGHKGRGGSARWTVESAPVTSPNGGLGGLGGLFSNGEPTRGSKGEGGEDQEQEWSGAEKKPTKSTKSTICPMRREVL